MKFTAVVLVALSTGASAFSVSMSSYLDNLGGASVSSFAPSAGASYGASAPAPAAPMYSPPPAAAAPESYTSAFADLPANTDLNYLKSIGGGNAMKTGKNFSGVSSAYPSVPESGYLGNVKSAAMSSFAPGAAAPAPAAAPASYSEPAPAAAPVNTGSYLNALGGAAPQSSSYSNMQSSFAGSAPAPAHAPASTGSYLSSL